MHRKRESYDYRRRRLPFGTLRCLHCGEVVTFGVDDDEARTPYWEDRDGYPYCAPTRERPHTHA